MAATLTDTPLAGDELTPYEREDDLEENRCPECGQPPVSTPNHEWCIRCAQDVQIQESEQLTHPTGKPPEMRLAIENRFWEKVDWGDPDECWEWDRYITPTGTGYGYFQITGKGKVPAHRVALALHNELTNPDNLPGEVVRHLCGGPSTCCNPHHLETGTQKDNMQDYIDREMDRENDRGYSPAEIREIRRLDAESGMTQYDIADEFGMTQAMVSEIVRRNQYAWVDDE